MFRIPWTWAPPSGRWSCIFRNAFFQRLIERTFCVKCLVNPIMRTQSATGSAFVAIFYTTTESLTTIFDWFDLFSLSSEKKPGRALLARMFSLKPGYVSSQSASKVERRQSVIHIYKYIKSKVHSTKNHGSRVTERLGCGHYVVVQCTPVH